MDKKKETYTFLGKDYPMERAMDALQTDDGDRLTPLAVEKIYGHYRATTTTWFDFKVFNFEIDNAEGRSPRAAIRALERQCIQEFKRLAKACGYTVTG